MSELPIIRSSRDMLDGRNVVSCPYCDFEYTHFVGVEFSGPTQFERGPTRTVTPWVREDHPGVEVEVVGGRRLSLEWSMPGSSRRGAVTLIFDGECGHSFALTIAQHKGQEFVHVSRLVRREEERDAEDGPE